ncbi:hypothetical protein HW555_005841 [Spodoptera exigua]|uniref:Endonuclease/exonuclease/phosphatase domain-containing protein n=1 Tax=Spodoptera exigua TaxID=7107 RepID=A0A835GJR8_SPOEX|nr:hypothetical protein HW555_005841 [Spodoptera exigua]
MDNIDFCDSSGSDIGGEEMVQDDDQLAKDRKTKEAEKRGRSDSEEIIVDDEGYITVRDKKRAARRSRQTPNNLEINENTNTNISVSDKIIVCVTSNDILPKPFGMAKLLKSENIEGILKIQYKNPYKISIQFEKRKDAENLMSCSKFQSLNYRCQFIDEINLSYGLVKQIDLEIEEKEFLVSIECEKELVSVKRLKRQSDSGEWIQSETMRICFKSSILPPYILIYGCRFKVEPYTFPVSQCSGCWRFGHLIKSCPTKKIMCPKCGGNHGNCETEVFKCINCKGPHMSLNKSCPIFIKEKTIRQIMCEENCTYRKALLLYLNKSKLQQDNEKMIIQDNVTQTSQIPLSINKEKSYRDVLLTVHNHSEHLDSLPQKAHIGERIRDMTMEEHENLQFSSKPKRKINRRRKKQYEEDEVFEVGQNSNEDIEDTDDQQKETCSNIFYLKRLWDKLKEIYFAKSSISVKIRQSDWDELFSIYPNKTLIAGDFNGHHSNWSYKTDGRGNQIMDSALEYGYIPINDGSATRLSKVVAERRLALKAFRRNPSPANLTVLKYKTLIANLEIRQTKTTCWQEYCSSVDGKVTSSQMWRKMKWIKGIRQAGCYVSMDKKTELLRNLAPDTTLNPKPPFTSNNALLESEFTLQELEACIKKKDTAPGDDNVTYSMIFNLPIVAKTYLLRIYNCIFVTGCIPNEWRDIKVIAIPKASIY